MQGSYREGPSQTSHLSRAKGRASAMPRDEIIARRCDTRGAPYFFVPEDG